LPHFISEPLGMKGRNGIGALVTQLGDVGPGGGRGKVGEKKKSVDR